MSIYLSGIYYDIVLYLFIRVLYNKHYIDTQFIRLAENILCIHIDILYLYMNILCLYIDAFIFKMFIHYDTKCDAVKLVNTIFPN